MNTSFDYRFVLVFIAIIAIAVILFSFKKLNLSSKISSLLAFLTLLVTIVTTVFGPGQTIVINLNDYQTNSELLKKAAFDYDAGNWDLVLDTLCNRQLRDDTFALCNIGYLYSNGIGLEQNLVKAEKYYKQAIALSSNEAKLGLLGAYLHNDLNKATAYIMSNINDPYIIAFLHANMEDISIEDFINSYSDEQKNYILSHWFEYNFTDRFEFESTKSDSVFMHYEFVSSRKEISENFRTVNYYTYDTYQYKCLVDEELYYVFRTM